jgi:hypothetical protein
LNPCDYNLWGTKTDKSLCEKSTPFAQTIFKEKLLIFQDKSSAMCEPFSGGASTA